MTGGGPPAAADGGCALAGIFWTTLDAPLAVPVAVPEPEVAGDATAADADAGAAAGEVPLVDAGCRDVEGCAAAAAPPAAGRTTPAFPVPTRMAPASSAMLDTFRTPAAAPGPTATPGPAAYSRLAGGGDEIFVAV